MQLLTAAAPKPAVEGTAKSDAFGSLRAPAASHFERWATVSPVEQSPLLAGSVSSQRSPSAVS